MMSCHFLDSLPLIAPSTSTVPSNAGASIKGCCVMVNTAYAMTSMFINPLVSPFLASRPLLQSICHRLGQCPCHPCAVCNAYRSIWYILRWLIIASHMITRWIHLYWVVIGIKAYFTIRTAVRFWWLYTVTPWAHPFSLWYHLKYSSSISETALENE